MRRASAPIPLWSFERPDFLQRRSEAPERRPSNSCILAVAALLAGRVVSPI